MKLILSPKIALWGLLLLAAVWAWVPAIAGANSGLMGVSVTVLPVCRVATVAVGAVNVSCTAGAPFDVAVVGAPKAAPARQLASQQPSTTVEGVSAPLTVIVTY